MSSDFDFLAQETLKLCEKLSSGNDFDVMRNMSYEAFEQSFLAQTPKASTELKPGPGVLFWTSKSQGTYSIRGILSKDVKVDYEKYLSHDQQILTQLKLQDSNDKDLQVFPTYSIFEARYIHQNILNRRILLQEEWATNISDPGNHWWLIAHEDYLEIQFGNRGMYSKENVIELGPLGDGRGFSKILNSHIDFLTTWIPFKEFSSSYKSLHLVPESNKNENYQILKNIFLQGEIFEGVDSAPENLNQILYQLSWARKFWIFTESFL